MQKALRKGLGIIYRRVMPNIWQNHIDIARAKNSWLKSGVIFVHTPKAAGVSLSNALYGKPLGHIKAKVIRDISPKLFDRLYSFAFVREPESRFRSAVRYAKQNYKEIAGSPGLPDESMLDDLNNLIETWLVNQSIEEVNYIFRPQYLFLCDCAGAVIVSDVYRFEEFEAEVKRLNKRLSTPLEVGKKNSSQVTKTPAAISEQALVLLKEYYRRDYEIFGYAR